MTNKKRVDKVVLVNIGAYREYGQIDEGLGVASVGLESIAAHLQNNDIPVTLIDQAMYGLSDEAVLTRIIAEQPSFIGFNPLINSRQQVGKLASRIKRILPETIVIIGGYDATFLSLTNPDYTDVDVIVRGKGEIPMVALATGTPASQIQGVSYRNGERVIDNLEQRAAHLSPDTLPQPRRENYAYLAEKQEPVSVYASYGCYYTCKFCSTPAFYPEGRIIRPLEDVLEEIDLLADHGINKFSFYDEDFYGLSKKSLERVTAIINRVKKREGTITFSFITTDGIRQAERLGYLHQWEGTVNRLYVGIEGGCDQALTGLGNASCVKSVRNAEAIETVRKYNLGLQIGFIMFNPYSTFDELEASARFLYDHHEAVNGISFFHHLRPYPGTVMYEQLREHGLLLEEALAQLDLHSSLPYHFKTDTDSGTEHMKNFARAICPTSGERAVCASDKLNNEIYSSLVGLGYGREIFNGSLAPDIVVTYREMRREISDIHYRFFTESLETFRNHEGKGFEEKKELYLQQLATYVPLLLEIKQELTQL